MHVGLIRSLLNKDDAVKVLFKFAEYLRIHKYSFWAKTLHECAIELSSTNSIVEVIHLWNEINRMAAGPGSIGDLPIKGGFSEGLDFHEDELDELSKVYRLFKKYFTW